MESVASNRDESGEVKLARSPVTPIIADSAGAEPPTAISAPSSISKAEPGKAVSSIANPVEFDPSLLENSKPGLGARLLESLSVYPQRLLRLLRWFTPALNLPFLGWSWVLRYNEVREVLSHDAEFPVPWRDKMKELTSQRNFVLGMARDQTYRDTYEQLAKAFPRDDVPAYVTPQARKETEQILADKYDERPFDAIQEVIAAVPTRMCESYYGIPISQRETSLFAKANLAISRYLFVPDTSNADKNLAQSAAAFVSGKIRVAIGFERQESKSAADSPLTRLVQMERDDERIHAQILGMVLGFIPTNVLAGGNILQTLLLEPSFMRACVRAARADNDDLLWRCLREALRFRHINLGPWRLCPNGYTLGAGGSRPIKIPAGNKVLAIVQTAMFDPKCIDRPHSFDPDRPDEHYMVFGVGQHWCLGAYIAAAQLTQTFKVLLRKGRLEAACKAERMKRFSVYPLHLNVRIRQA